MRPARLAFVAVLSWTALGAPLLRAAPAAGPTPAEAAEIVPLLQKFYDDPALLQGLRGPDELAALWPRLQAHGVSLTDEAEPVGRQQIRTEILPGHFGYWRAAGFAAPKGWPALAAELAAWQADGVGGLVLDLRNSAGFDPEDFAGAGRAASCFLPPGKVSFSLQGLQVPQQVFETTAAPGLPFTQPLVVLVNRQTRGAAEALADALRRQAGAILVGRSTPGEAALFVERRHGPLRGGLRRRRRSGRPPRRARSTSPRASTPKTCKRRTARSDAGRFCDANHLRGFARLTKTVQAPALV